jgi:hypothetical protein
MSKESNMKFQDIKLYSVFSNSERLYLKVSENVAINQYGTVLNFAQYSDAFPVAKTFEITFEDLIDSIDKGKQFEYNGTIYLRIAGHRQALNLTTYCVETFI